MITKLNLNVFLVLSIWLLASCLNQAPQNNSRNNGQNRVKQSEDNKNSNSAKDSDKTQDDDSQQDEKDNILTKIDPDILEGIKSGSGVIIEGDDETPNNSEQQSMPDLPSDSVVSIDPQTWEHADTSGSKLTAFQLYQPNTYHHNSKFNLHFFATKGSTANKFDATVEVFTQVIERVKPEYQSLFSGHHIFMITFADPDVPGAALQGHKNTGNVGFVIITEELICADRVFDTLYPDNELTDTVWRTPLHELGHSIELTLGIRQKTGELLDLNHPNEPSDTEYSEKFAWLTESWFNQGLYTDRINMLDWEKTYFGEVFLQQNFTPSCNF